LSRARLLRASSQVHVHSESMTSGELKHAAVDFYALKDSGNLFKENSLDSLNMMYGRGNINRDRKDIRDELI